MGAAGSHSKCEDQIAAARFQNSKEVCDSIGTGNLDSITDALCGGTCGVPSSPKKPPERLVISEDLPFFIPGCGDQPPPSRWRRFNQKHRRAPRVPPLRLPIRKAAPAAAMTPKMQKLSPAEASTLASSTRCQRRPMDCPSSGMPRLPRPARIQIASKELTGETVSEDPIDSTSIAASECNAGEEALESVKAMPVILRREEGAWVDIELKESAPEYEHRLASEPTLISLPSLPDEELSLPLLTADTSSFPWSLGPLMTVGNSCSSSNIPTLEADDERESGASSSGLKFVAPPEVALELENQDPNIPKLAAISEPTASRKSLHTYEEQLYSERVEPFREQSSPVTSARERHQVPIEEGMLRVVPRSASCRPFKQNNVANGLLDDLEAQYEPWSAGLAQSITQESQMAKWVNAPELISFFFVAEECESVCSTRPPSSDGAATGRSSETLAISDLSSEATDRGDSLFAILAEVADRPFPLELLLLSTAFARLVGIGAGDSIRRPLTVNSGHHEVEALLLKYTAFASRRDLRAELEAWFPDRDAAKSLVAQRYDLAQPSKGACRSDRSPKRRVQPLSHAIEGPDNDGPSLTFEALAAFISTHAAPKDVLAEAFANMLRTVEQPYDVGCYARFVPRKMARQGLEAALVPLLAGLPSAAAGNGRNATLAARRIASRATILAIRGHDRVGAYLNRFCDPDLSSEEAHLVGSKHWLGMAEFMELFGKAASIARMSTMYLTGDTKRWQNCLPSPSPRIDLRCSMGGA